MNLTIERTVGERGQVVIPKPIREMFDLRPGASVYFSVEDDAILVRTGSNALEEYLATGASLEEPESIDWDAAYYARYTDER